MNILLVNHDVEKIHTILPEVIKELRKLGEGHRYHAAHDVKPGIKHFLWGLNGQPTLVISFRPIENFLPSWATILQPKPLACSMAVKIFEIAVCSAMTICTGNNGHKKPQQITLFLGSLKLKGMQRISDGGI